MWHSITATLQKIATQGASTFYTGELAQDIVEEITAAGGIVTLNDLANYTVEVLQFSLMFWTQQEREPLTTFFHGYQIFGANAPISGGPCSIQALNMLEGFNLPLMYNKGTNKKQNDDT